MIISISGTHSTGKTSLLESLKKETLFNQYSFIGSPTREAKKSGMKINNEARNFDSTQRFCLEYDLEILSRYERDQQPLITDRSLFDTFIYTKYLHRKNKVSDKVYLDVLDNWRRLRNKYTLFIIPDKDDVELVLDEDRVDDTLFREGIYNLFNVEMLEMSNILEISGSNEQRLEQIRQYFINEKHNRNSR